jgi:nucleotide-binding universal stress UspA family protein
MSKKIVVALDGSDNCLAALRGAADLADARENGLALLYVFPYKTATMAGLKDIDRDQLESFKDKAGAEVFKRAEAELGDRCAVTDRHLLWGEPAEEIIEFIRSNPDTFMIMGRLGRSRINRLVLGSVSDKVIRYAPGMVAVV